MSADGTLYPGDVSESGTVGEGCGPELRGFLESGNRVALSVEGIDTFENRVVAPGDRSNSQSVYRRRTEMEP